MRLGKPGLIEIEQSEGFSSAPYWDAIGQAWTRGFGRTFGINKNSPRITRKQGEVELINEFAERYAWALKPFENLPGFTQNMYDALASFIWNCGTGAVAASTTVGKHLRAGRWKDAADALLAWSKAGGKTIPGLLARRRRERKLFLKPVVVVLDAFLTTWEKKTVEVLEDERQIAKRHGGWSKIDESHLKRAARAKEDLRQRVAELRRKDTTKAHRDERIKVMLAVIG